MRLVLTRTPRRLLPVVWVVTLLVASGASTPRLRAVHRDRAARATAPRSGVARTDERDRSIAPDPDHGALSCHGVGGGEPRGPRRLAAVVPPRLLVAGRVAVAAEPASLSPAPASRWSARPRPARGPPA